MKNLTFYTLVFALFSFIFVQTNTVNAQIIEDDWEYTSGGDTSDKLPQDLKKSLIPKIVVSPNPTTSRQISVWYNQLKETSKIKIYDAAGRLYHTATVGSVRESKGVHSVPASKFSPGVYIVKLKSGIYESVAKFVIR